MLKIAIFGASSAIAYETAKHFAAKKCELMLLGRDVAKVESIKDDLIARSDTKIQTMHFDASNIKSFEGILSSIITEMGGLDMVLIAYGDLPDHLFLQSHPDEICNSFNTNALSVIKLATVVTNYFEEKQAGTIAVISSVAGDRGRQSNYYYGAAKAAVSTFLQGLRNRLSKSGIKVITIKPGMVDTPMTEAIPKSILFASASSVGKGIYEAMMNGSVDVVYLPGYWRLIMFIIKHIPEKIFKNLKL